MLYGILLNMEKDSRRDLFQTNHSEAVSSLSGRPERNITVMNKTIPEIIHRRVPTTRYEADPSEGLSAEQVAEYRENGWTNRAVEPPSKTTAEIVKSNVCTYFNLIFLIIAIFLILAGSFRDLTFLPVIIANTLIGIVQEIKAKKTLEKLSVLNAPKATAIRDGAEVTLAAEDLVLDDIVVFTAGKQICADAVVLEGEVQVNESLLTGESDEITKRPGDELMSGSFIVSGSCKSRLTQVGEDSYISRLTLEAKAMKEGEQSEMIRSLNKLVKVVGILIIPIGLLLFGQQFFVSHETFRESITSMVAAVLGMIPEGLYLLASVALAVSVMRLASQKVLVHDMKCIETLARVNVLCVDKTGTITETNMKVHDLILVGSSSVPDTESDENAPAPQKEELSLAVGDFASAMSNDNITMAALKEYFKDNNGKTAVSMTSFSSEFKYSSVTFSDVSYVLGAPEFVLRDDFARYQSEIEAYTSKGFRLLVFGTSETVPDGKALSGRVTPLGYVLLSNPIRKEAPETFRYFKDQGVHVKVISGDTPVTVSEVARQAGIAHAEDYIDASKYADDALAAETKEAKKANLQAIKDNLVAMFIQSGVADCESLQNIYGPKVEASKTDSAFLKKALNILKLMKCNESEVYFKASEYMYQIDPTADAAVGVAYMYYKKGDYDNAVKYFDEALAKETDNDKKAEMAYATAAALMQAKKLSQARSYCQKAMSFKENYGEPYILLAQLYGSNPNWTDEPALNKCTYFVVIDKLQRAKAVDPSVTERANELISTYSRHTPQAKDLFMLGYKAGDRITIGGWIGESTTIR